MSQPQQTVSSPTTNHVSVVSHANPGRHHSKEQHTRSLRHPEASCLSMNCRCPPTPLRRKHHPQSVPVHDQALFANSTCNQELLSRLELACVALNFIWAQLDQQPAPNDPLGKLCRTVSRFDSKLALSVRIIRLEAGASKSNTTMSSYLGNQA